MTRLRSISRRTFGQLFGAGAACALTTPKSLLSAKANAHAFSSSPVLGSLVRLNSNENPYGPSPLAIRAMTEAFGLAWRYPDEHADALIETLATINSVAREQIVLGDGSGEILKMCAGAFTGPMNTDSRVVPLSRPTRGGALNFTPGRGRMVVADPTFEAIVNHGRVSGAEVFKVPLTTSFSHDLDKMEAAAVEGLIYICNPNNPTASITPKNEVRKFLQRVSPRTMVLVDEAYFHYADNSEYESVLPLIKAYPNLIVARTFSKIYGMAGLRCGYCIAQPETIQRLRPHQTWDSVNILALAAANASLNDAEHVRRGRRLNTETRSSVISELDKIGYGSIPSHANFMMIDLKRPARPLIEAMNKRGVQVGRPFPSLPNHMRVTIGKPAEMDAFLFAFKQVVREQI
jgi:histidinol-phosphate aminotransferase